MKAQRHAAILSLVHRQRVTSQEHLRSLLQGEGVAVTQATLSRDIRELGLVKVADPDGGAHYAPPPQTEVVQPSLGPLVSNLLLSMEGVGPLLVLRTPAGSANALGSALDRQSWEEIVGTIAGDDTLLVITRSETARTHVVARLEELRAGG